MLQTEPQVYITTSNRRKLFSKSAMARVNRQVREEFNSLLQVAAFDLVAEVKNFNFSHVVTFLHKMDGKELANLPTAHVPSERRMTIKLITPDVPGSHPNWEMLQRWLNRLDHPDKNVRIVDGRRQLCLCVEEPDLHPLHFRKQLFESRSLLEHAVAAYLLLLTPHISFGVFVLTFGRAARSISRTRPRPQPNTARARYRSLSTATGSATIVAPQDCVKIRRGSKSQLRFGRRQTGIESTERCEFKRRSRHQRGR